MSGEKGHGTAIRLYVSYQVRKQGEGKVWLVLFLQDGRQIGRHRVFASDDKIRAIFDRAAEGKMLENRHALDNGMRNGRGGFFIVLSGDEYRRLRDAGQ